MNPMYDAVSDSTVYLARYNNAIVDLRHAELRDRARLLRAAQRANAAYLRAQAAEDYIGKRVQYRFMDSSTLTTWGVITDAEYRGETLWLCIIPECKYITRRWREVCMIVE